MHATISKCGTTTQNITAVECGFGYNLCYTIDNLM